MTQEKKSYEYDELLCLNNLSTENLTFFLLLFYECMNVRQLY